MVGGGSYRSSPRIRYAESTTVFVNVVKVGETLLTHSWHSAFGAAFTVKFHSLIHTPAGGAVYQSNNSRVRGTEPQLLCLPCWEPVTCWELTATLRAVNHRQWVHPRGGLALAGWGSDSVPASHILHSQLSSDKGDIWSPMWFTPLSRFLTDAELK